MCWEAKKKLREMGPQAPTASRDEAALPGIFGPRRSSWFLLLDLLKKTEISTLSLGLRFAGANEIRFHYDGEFAKNTVKVRIIRVYLGVLL